MLKHYRGDVEEALSSLFPNIHSSEGDLTGKNHFLYIFCVAQPI